MKLRITAIITVLIFCLVFTTACQYSPLEDPSILYKSDNVEVSLIENTNKNQHVDYEWVALTDDVAYTKNTVIVTGTVFNVRQATVAYEYMDTDVVDNITIFDVEISDVLACRSGSFKQGDTITMGIGYNMNHYSEELSIIENGKTYLMFCYVAADDKGDVLELSEYVDCWISAPKDLFLEKTGDNYLSIDYFSDVPGSVQLADCLSLTEEQITSLSNVNNIDNTDDIISSIYEEINTTNAKYAAEALIVLKNRTITHPAEFYNLIERSYLINCEELEEYIRNTALLYDN